MDPDLDFSFARAADAPRHPTNMLCFSDIAEELSPTALAREANFQDVLTTLNHNGNSYDKTVATLAFVAICHADHIDYKLVQAIRCTSGSRHKEPTLRILEDAQDIQEGQQPLFDVSDQLLDELSNLSAFHLVHTIMQYFHAVQIIHLDPEIEIIFSGEIFSVLMTALIGEDYQRALTFGNMVNSHRNPMPLECWDLDPNLDIEAMIPAAAICDRAYTVRLVRLLFRTIHAFTAPSRTSQHPEAIVTLQQTMPQLLDLIFDEETFAQSVFGATANMRETIFKRTWAAYETYMETAVHLYGLFYTPLYFLKKLATTRRYNISTGNFIADLVINGEEFDRIELWPGNILLPVRFLPSPIAADFRDEIVRFFDDPMP